LLNSHFLEGVSGEKEGNWSEGYIPRTTTSLLFQSNVWSHWAEWNILPLKVSAPGMSHCLGTESEPTPETRIFARRIVCCLVFRSSTVTTHTLSTSSHTAFSTIEWKRTCSTTRYRSATERKYSWISGRMEYFRLQSGFRAKL
jgi:hypothetical protein